MKHIIRFWILTILCITLSDCKKDDDKRQVVFTTERPCEYDNLDDPQVTHNCSASGPTLMIAKGGKVNYQVYSNCSSPKQEAHLVITVKNGKKKEKVVYDSRAILHNVNLTID